MAYDLLAIDFQPVLYSLQYHTRIIFSCGFAW